MSRLIEIVSTTDGRHEVYFGMDNSETASFYLMMWITHYGPRAVDMVQALSLGFCSFMGGNIWVHNSNTADRCNLFGEQRDCKVGVVANEQPNIVKLLDSIGIHTDGEWEVESITIPKTLNNPSGMYSKIPTARFKRREGILQAEFLRNMKTSSGKESVIEAIKGETLRGYAAYLILKNTSTEQVKLFKVDINMNKSR